MSKTRRSVNVQSKTIFYRRNDDHDVHSEKDEEVIFNSTGYMECNDGEYKIKYPEACSGEKEPTFSTITFSDNVRTEATVVRSGGTKSTWFFENEKRHQVSEHYFFGDFSFCLNTISLKNNIQFETGGKFETEYIMEVNGVSFERVVLSVNVS